MYNNTNMKAYKTEIKNDINSLIIPKPKQSTIQKNINTIDNILFE